MLSPGAGPHHLPVAKACSGDSFRLSGPGAPSFQPIPTLFCPLFIKFHRLFDFSCMHASIFGYHHPPVNSHWLPIEFHRFPHLPNAFGPTIHHPTGFPSNSTGFLPFHTQSIHPSICLVCQPTHPSTPIHLAANPSISVPHSTYRGLDPTMSTPVHLDSNQIHPASIPSTTNLPSLPF